MISSASDNCFNLNYLKSYLFFYIKTFINIIFIVFIYRFELNWKHKMPEQIRMEIIEGKNKNKIEEI